MKQYLGTAAAGLSVLAACILAIGAACAFEGATPVSEDAAIVAAVGDSTRPADDVRRDAVRKPALTLAFAGVKAGQRVGEYMPGGGYFTRILAKAVGPDGRIYAFVPAEIVNLAPKYLTDARALAAEPTYANVTVTTAPTAAFATPEPLDVMFTALNYHDLHLSFSPPGVARDFNAAVFRALKPGGVYLVIDHHAAPGAGVNVANSLHRIDVSTVKAEITAAGFVLDAESEALRAPADPRTANVFDPAIRGATDQFMLRFRKPG